MLTYQMGLTYLLSDGTIAASSSERFEMLFDTLRVLTKVRYVGIVSET